jgi:hypothetical protein
MEGVGGPVVLTGLPDGWIPDRLGRDAGGQRRGGVAVADVVQPDRRPLRVLVCMGTGSDNITSSGTRQQEPT